MDQVLVSLLSTYSGRDKLVRTSSYVAMLLSGATKGAASKKFGTVATQLSAARVVLRLFDDLPMWKAVTSKYGLGKHVSSLGNLVGGPWISGHFLHDLVHRTDLVLDNGRVGNAN